MQCPVDLGAGHLVVCGEPFSKIAVLTPSASSRWITDRGLFAVDHIFLGVETRLSALKTGSRKGMSSIHGDQGYV